MCIRTISLSALISILHLLCVLSASSDELFAFTSTLGETGILTSSSNFINALSLDFEMPYDGDILVVASYNAQITQGVRTKGAWRLESGGRFSSVNERFLSNTADIGIGSIAFIGTNAPAGPVTINLQHSSDNKPIITSHVRMIALPLITSGGSKLNYGFFNNSSTTTVSVTSFQDISATTSVSVVLSGSSVLISCSLNSSTEGSAETGEWKLQYKKKEDVVWMDTSYATKRHMTGTDDSGSIVLYAMFEDLDVGEYDVRLVVRSDTGNAVNTFNVSLAAINLAYTNGLDGGSFPSVVTTSLGGETSSSIAEAIPGALISFTPHATGSLFALLSFSGLPIGAKKQTCVYDIAVTNAFTSQTNQNISRYFSDTVDWGSGGSIALFTNLNTESYSLLARHRTDSSTVGTSNITLIGISTISSVLDSDQDGMPNDYEYRYFGDPTNALATADQDGDGIDNFGEYITNCDPNDSNSVFTVVLATGFPDQYPRLEWTASQGRIYDVYWTSNLFDAFEIVQPDVVYPQNTFTDLVHSVDMTGFYLLKVRLP